MVVNIYVWPGFTGPGNTVFVKHQYGLRIMHMFSAVNQNKHKHNKVVCIIGVGIIYVLIQTISGVTILPHSGRSRLTLSFLWVIVIVILASYSGTLISYLAVDIRSLPFSSLKQVIISPSYNIWMNTESIYAEIFGVSIHMNYFIHLGQCCRHVSLKQLLSQWLDRGCHCDCLTYGCYNYT